MSGGGDRFALSSAHGLSLRCSDGDASSGRGSGSADGGRREEVVFSFKLQGGRRTFSLKNTQHGNPINGHKRRRGLQGLFASLHAG